MPGDNAHTRRVEVAKPLPSSRCSLRRVSRALRNPGTGQAIGEGGRRWIRRHNSVEALQQTALPVDYQVKRVPYGAYPYMAPGPSVPSSRHLAGAGAC